MSGRCPSASQRSRGQVGSSPPDGVFIIVKADGSVQIWVRYSIFPSIDTLQYFPCYLLESRGAKQVC